jgi:hypothetical protein
MPILNSNELLISSFVGELRNAYQRMYSDLESEYGDIVAWCGRLALEVIANSDMLYHDVEHTVMVSLAGLSIIEGRHIRDGGVTPRDWMHYMIALACHDIGYVKGVCQNDTENKFATGVGDALVELHPSSTDASLAPYHVDRSKLFVHERFGTDSLMDLTQGLDADLICSYVEMTRFPSPDEDFYNDTKGYGGLVRAADFIGQLGDPNQQRKAPALYHEFEEIGANEKMGYASPGDLRDKYAKFYWGMVSPYIQDALQYLQMTQHGKQWLASLHSNVFVAEHKRIG